jgi:polyribonucleotide nucleotidyltransferase
MFTQEKINTLSKAYDELELIKADLDKAYEPVSLSAQERSYKVTRNGKEVDIAEDTLWYELRNLGTDVESDAKTILKPLYPELFDLSELYNKKVLEISEFALKELNIDPLKISFIGIVRIVTGLIDMKMKEKGL